jgi:hypothetical protein
MAGFGRLGDLGTPAKGLLREHLATSTNVRKWHLADVRLLLSNVRFWGVKDFQSVMSAFDPSRTWASQNFCSANLSLNPISPVANPCCNSPLKVGVVLSLGIGDATALRSRQPG